MLDVNELYEDLKDLSEKNYGGYITPGEFNRLLQKANLQYFTKLYGSVDEYRYDKPTAHIAYPSTKLISEKLNRFVASFTIPFTSPSVSLPDNHFRTVTVWHAYNDESGAAHKVSARRSELDRVQSWNNSVLNQPTKEFPIYWQTGNNLDFSPVFDGGEVKYLREPVQPNWAFTVVDNRPVYDQVNSTQMEWDEEDRNEILFLMASLAGMAIKDGELINYSETKARQ